MFNPVTIHSEDDKDEETGKYKLEIVVLHLIIYNFIDHKFMKITVLQK